MSEYIDTDRAIELKKQGLSWPAIAKTMGFDDFKAIEKIRNRCRKHPEYDSIKQIQSKNQSDNTRFQKKDIKSDGSIGSEIRIGRRNKKVFTDEELLKLHGFDPEIFKLKSITSNEWTTPIAGSTYYNYQSKIVAVRKEPEVTAEDIKKVFESIQPREIELSSEEIPKEYLLIPLADMHFGLNTFLDYEQLQKEIADRIINRYEEILITFHGDYFHVDNFQNTTEKGTRVEDIDFEKSIEDGLDFISPLLELALKNSPSVKVAYLKGNHAPSIDFMFLLALTRLYPQIEFDKKIEEFKHVWLGQHSIFLHHGDKVKSPTKLHQIMVSKFRKEWGESKSCYLITGHLHHEKSMSFAGITWYQLQSPSKSTKYEEDNGFNTSESGQMLFEFTEHKRSAIYYV